MFTEIDWNVTSWEWEDHYFIRKQEDGESDDVAPHHPFWLVDLFSAAGDDNVGLMVMSCDVPTLDITTMTHQYNGIRIEERINIKHLRGPSYVY